MTSNTHSYDSSALPNASLGAESGSLDTLAGATFVIPLDAPIPNELVGGVTNTGNLYSRIRPLAEPQSGDGHSFVAISGSELLAMERCWHHFQEASKVYVLKELPGARYDVLFDQATRAIGLRTVDWPHVANVVEATALRLQRTADTTPWALKKVDTASAPSVPKKAGLTPTRLPRPAPDDMEV